jgi:checkpoint serine/threonine-protein kinase
MTASDLIDFEVIEGHKENIQALPSGRSARALAALYSPPLTGGQQRTSLTKDAHDDERKEYEDELALIDEADDPLDIYDRYVKWTLDTYPSAQSTPQSQLLPLLERATKAFLSSPQYKNDPRYLKLWLHYIRFFSDAPRETFVFLNRHGVAESLALYYEEFAAWLEHAGRWTQAEEVYSMGIEKGATPVARLTRKSNEFQQRNAARDQHVAEPTSPALPVARAVLGAKVDPFAAALAATTPQQAAKSAATKKSKAGKMAIFADDSPQDQGAFGTPGEKNGWDNIESIQNRKKENAIAPKPMAGETLKGGKTNTGVQKMAIFRVSIPSSSPSFTYQIFTNAGLTGWRRFCVFQSSSTVRHAYESSKHASQRVINLKTGRPECVFVNLEAVYPNPSDPSVEFCFEELRARHRGWLDRDWAAERVQAPSINQAQEPSQTSQQPKESKRGFAIFSDAPASKTQPEQERPTSQRGFQIFQDDSENKSSPARSSPLTIDTSLRVVPIRDENDENRAPSKADVELAKRLRREERANRTRKIEVMDVEHVQRETQTIKLNMDSPSGKKLRKKKVAEPTMTINTKEAMDEIYGIFSQPVETAADEDAEESESEDDSDDDSDESYSSDEEDTTTGHVSAAGSDYGDETQREILASQQSSQEETTQDTEDQQDDDEDKTDISAWSDYDENKPVTETAATSANSRDGLSTPIDEMPPMFDGENGDHKMKYVPIPPEGYEPVRSQYRDPVLVAQNRLPFMTPIVEHTESSIGAATIRAELEKGFTAKTPSRQTHDNTDIEEEEEDEEDEDDDSLMSSPFQVLSGAELENKRKILQPIRTKTAKGIVSLSEDVVGAAKPKPLALRPALAESITKGPIIKDPQINPVDPEIRQTILSQINPPLSSYEGYYEHKNIQHARTPEIRKYSKAVGKGKTVTEKNSASLPLAPVLNLENSKYTLKRELGAGAFAPVYLLENHNFSASSEATNENDENASVMGQGTFSAVQRHALEALKMEDPPSAWEFYMLRQVHRRLGVSRATESVIHAYEMHMFRDEGFLIEEFRGQGTLLDLINVARAEAGGTLDEALAMFFATELIRTVEGLHSKGLIHGDLKGDNVLVRLDDCASWSSTYDPCGANGWKAKGISLIDFGRGIDMRVFAPEVQFVADWETSSADCAEMKEMRPWTYQVDYHGLAGLLHSLLFGKYMSTIADKGQGIGAGATKHYKIKEGLKRYWQQEIWGEAFEMLLNPTMFVKQEEHARMPLSKGLRGLREKMEAWLVANCDKGVGLKTMVRKMEEAVKAKKR